MIKVDIFFYLNGASVKMVGVEDFDSVAEAVTTLKDQITSGTAYYTSTAANGDVIVVRLPEVLAFNVKKSVV